MRYLIAIDDTDNLESRGTGFRARQLGALLAEHGLAEVDGITRHQLFVSPRIPYTSHNSAACLAIRSNASREDLRAACGEFLLAESAPGSDAGLCIAEWNRVSEAVRIFGRRAKREVLTQDNAWKLTKQTGLVLAGYTGTRGGVIGALAAVGLRAGGSDGRFLWVRGIRELECGHYRVADLLEQTGIERLQGLDGTPVHGDDPVDVNWQPRPVLLDGKAVLLVEKIDDSENPAWRSAPKEIVKRH